AGVILAALGHLTGGRRPHGMQWLHTAALALLNFAVFFPLLVVAIYRLPGGVAASAGGVQPLLVAALSAALGVSVPRRRDLVVGIIAAIGVALVVVRPGASVDPVGVLAALGANVSFALGVVLTKRFPAPANRVGSTGWQLLVSAVAIVPIALIVEGAPPALSPAHVGGFTYLSLLATGGAFVLWFSGIGRLPSQVPPLLGLAAPVTGAILGWLIVDEHLSPVQLLGFAVTIGAITYGTTRGSAGATNGATNGATLAASATAPVRDLRPGFVLVQPLGQVQSFEQKLCCSRDLS
ncbi:MAG TPA: EamA family transporter, partial [Ilumatobacter sp.]|nr:EamA family transporter [Ilumatobacter sp.]